MKTSRTIPIFEYHSISPPQGERDARLTVSPEHFAEQMDWLADQGYQTLTLSQYFQQSDTLPERSVLLTFDDGFADFAENALPILRQHRFSATLYVVTAYIGQYNGWEGLDVMPRRSLLGWSDLVALAEAGIEIGSHSHTHPVLDLLPEAEARDEIERSKALLEEHLACTISTFCYPYGYYDRHVQHLIAEAGFTTACAVLDALQLAGESPLALARLTIRDVLTIQALEVKLNQQPLLARQRAVRRGLTAFYRPYRAFKRREAIARQEPPL